MTGRLTIASVALAALGLVVALFFWWWPRSPPPHVYQVRIQVLDSDSSAVEGASIRASVGNEPQFLPDGWWEIEIPRAKLPSDRRVTVWAEKGSRVAETEVILGDSLVVSETLLLDALPVLEIRGIVVDESNNAITGARVSVVGYGEESVTTGSAGHFTLSSHATEGNVVRLHIEHDLFEAKEQNFGVDGGPAHIILEREAPD